MVVLSTMSFFVGIGILLFITGVFVDEPALTVIGGVFILVSGALVFDGGLQVKTGEIHDNTVDNTTDIDYTYTEVKFPVASSLDLGAVFMLLGAVIMYKGYLDFGED